MSQPKSHIALRITKVLTWITFSLALLLIAGRLSLKTAPVHNFAKHKAVSIANESLNGSLSIADIKGDLWNNFTINGITLVQSDTVVSLDTLGIQYDIWSLMSRTFKASKIKISGLNATIAETSDSTFNVQKLVSATDETEPAPEAPAFGIDLNQIILQNSSVFIQSETYVPDSTLRVEELNATGGLQIFEEITASLSSLSFKAKEGRLPSAISIETAGSYQGEEITLNRLIVETGHSLLTANAFANLKDSTFNAEAETAPLSLLDVQAYLENDLPMQELQLGLKAGGSFDSLHVELNAEGEGFDNFVATTDFSFSEGLTLNKMGIRADNIDLGYFTNDSVKATIAGFQATLEGIIIQDYPAMNATWGFTFYDIRYQQYVFERFFGSGTIKNEELMANFQLSDGEDKIVANPQIQQLFGEHPSWQIPIFVTQLNMGWWLQNPELSGELSFRGLVEGKGYRLSEEPWTFRFTPSESSKRPQTMVKKTGYPDLMIPNISKDTLVINDQIISDFSIDGSVTEDSLKAGGFVQLIDSKMSFNTAFANYLTQAPSYSYSVNTKAFNIAEIVQLEDFPTRINMKAKGTGQYFDPENLELQTRLLIDSSYVNGASFDRLNIHTQLENNILTISEGELVSEVIDGTFSGRRNLQDQSDPQNQLAINMKVKNLQPLASLAGVQSLNAIGTINGDITDQDSQLQFNGNIELNDVRYDTLLSAASIEGATKISIGDHYGYDFTLDISEPAYTQFLLQDIHFESKGLASADSLAGIFSLDIESEDAGEISQKGNYRINLNSYRTHLHWDTFDFKTPARLLSLQSPFRLSFENASLQTDTLELRSEQGTYLTLSVPYADSLRQQAWVRGPR